MILGNTRPPHRSFLQPLQGMTGPLPQSQQQQGLRGPAQGMESQRLARIGVELPLADQVGQGDPQAGVQFRQAGIQRVTEEANRQGCFPRQRSIRRDEMQLHHDIQLEKVNCSV